MQSLLSCNNFDLSCKHSFYSNECYMSDIFTATLQINVLWIHWHPRPSKFRNSSPRQRVSKYYNNKSISQKQYITVTLGAIYKSYAPTYLL